MCESVGASFEGGKISNKVGVNETEIRSLLRSKGKAGGRKEGRKEGLLFARTHESVCCRLKREVR